MTIFSHQNGDVTNISLSGSIDEKQAQAFRKHLLDIDLTSTKHVVFDFAEVDFIGSSGIGKLLLFYKRVNEHHIDITLRNLSDNSYDLFMQLHLDSLFQLVKQSKSTPKGT